MSQSTPDRRSARRAKGNHVFTVMVDEKSYPAELTDISLDGLQARVNATTFDEIREQIDSVRFGSMPPVEITLAWGCFDGSFGATFRDALSARPIVERVVAADGASPHLVLY